MIERGHLAIWKLSILLGLLSGPAFADRTIEGRVTVVRDVETIVVAGTTVRLNGLDGPEISTRIGREARSFVTRLVRGETVTFQLNGERTYDPRVSQSVGHPNQTPRWNPSRQIRAIASGVEAIVRNRHDRMIAPHFAVLSAGWPHRKVSA